MTSYARRRLWLSGVLGACVLLLAVTAAYALSLEEWGNARAIVFEVVTVLCLGVGGGALALLLVDVARGRRA